jgi:hypothetical protein
LLAAPLGCSARLLRGAAPRPPAQWDEWVSGGLQFGFSLQFGAFFFSKGSILEPNLPRLDGDLLLAAVLQWSFLGKRTPLQPQQQFSGNFIIVSRRRESIYYYSNVRVCTFENH